MQPIQTEIQQILQSFIGKQQQIPPMYSAIKINGKKLYEYARNNIEIERQPRDIEIYDISLDNVDLENSIIKFTVSCSKGTYIRVLCEDIATKLGAYGHMSNLRRIKVGDFNIQQAVALENLENNKENKDFLDTKIISLEKLFCNKEKVILNNARLPHFLNGVNLSFNLKNEIYRIYDENNNFIGTGIIKDNLLKRDIIL